MFRAKSRVAGERENWPNLCTDDVTLIAAFVNSSTIVEISVLGTSATGIAK
jgi:hypothetical protein